MITVEVRYFSETDFEEAKRFMKDAKAYLPEYFGNTCNEIYGVQIASIDRRIRK